MSSGSSSSGRSSSSSLSQAGPDAPLSRPTDDGHDRLVASTTNNAAEGKWEDKRVDQIIAVEAASERTSGGSSPRSSLRSGAVPSTNLDTESRGGTADATAIGGGDNSQCITDATPRDDGESRGAVRTPRQMENAMSGAAPGIVGTVVVQRPVDNPFVHAERFGRVNFPIADEEGAFAACFFTASPSEAFDMDQVRAAMRQRQQQLPLSSPSRAPLPAAFAAANDKMYPLDWTENAGLSGISADETSIVGDESVADPNQRQLQQQQHAPRLPTVATAADSVYNVSYTIIGSEVDTFGGPGAGVFGLGNGAAATAAAASAATAPTPSVGRDRSQARGGDGGATSVTRIEAELRNMSFIPLRDLSMSTVQERTDGNTPGHLNQQQSSAAGGISLMNTTGAGFEPLLSPSGLTQSTGPGAPSTVLFGEHSRITAPGASVLHLRGANSNTTGTAPSVANTTTWGSASPMAIAPGGAPASEGGSATTVGMHATSATGNFSQSASRIPASLSRVSVIDSVISPAVFTSAARGQHHQSSTTVHTGASTSEGGGVGATTIIRPRSSSASRSLSHANASAGDSAVPTSQLRRSYERGPDSPPQPRPIERSPSMDPALAALHQPTQSMLIQMHNPTFGAGLGGIGVLTPTPQRYGGNPRDGATPHGGSMTPFIGMTSLAMSPIPIGNAGTTNYGGGSTPLPSSARAGDGMAATPLHQLVGSSSAGRDVGSAGTVVGNVQGSAAVPLPQFGGSAAVAAAVRDAQRLLVFSPRATTSNSAHNSNSGSAAGSICDPHAVSGVGGTQGGGVASPAPAGNSARLPDRLPPQVPRFGGSAIPPISSDRAPFITAGAAAERDSASPTAPGMRQAPAPTAVAGDDSKEELARALARQILARLGGSSAAVRHALSDDNLLQNLCQEACGGTAIGTAVLRTEAASHPTLVTAHHTQPSAADAAAQERQRQLVDMAVRFTAAHLEAQMPRPSKRDEYYSRLRAHSIEVPSPPRDGSPQRPPSASPRRADTAAAGASSVDLIEVSAAAQLAPSTEREPRGSSHFVAPSVSAVTGSTASAAAPSTARLEQLLELQTRQVAAITELLLSRAATGDGPVPTDADRVARLRLLAGAPHQANASSHTAARREGASAPAAERVSLTSEVRHTEDAPPQASPLVTSQSVAADAPHRHAGSTRRVDSVDDGGSGGASQPRRSVDPYAKTGLGSAHVGGSDDQSARAPAARRFDHASAFPTVITDIGTTVPPMPFGMAHPSLIERAWWPGPAPNSAVTAYSCGDPLARDFGYFKPDGAAAAALGPDSAYLLAVHRSTPMRGGGCGVAAGTLAYTTGRRHVAPSSTDAAGYAARVAVEASYPTVGAGFVAPRGPFPRSASGAPAVPAAAQAARARSTTATWHATMESAARSAAAIPTASVAAVRSPQPATADGPFGRAILSGAGAALAPRVGGAPLHRTWSTAQRLVAFPSTFTGSTSAPRPVASVGVGAIAGPRPRDLFGVRGVSSSGGLSTPPPKAQRSIVVPAVTAGTPSPRRALDLSVIPFAAAM